MQNEKKLKKTSGYKNSIIIYTMLLILATLTFLIYVTYSLKDYENNEIDNYMTLLVSDITKAAKKGKIEKYFTLSDIKNEYEDASYKEGYKELFSENEISYKKTNEENTYDLYAGDLKLAKIVLDDSNKKTTLALLTYTDWKIKEIQVYNKNGIYDLDFYLLSSHDLYINGVKVDKSNVDESKKIDGFEDSYVFLNLPMIDHYTIDNLTKKPEITVKNKNGEAVEYTYENGVYFATEYLQTDNETDAMDNLSLTFDSLDFAKKWSLFLTDDLGGARHGFYKLSPHLIKDTDIYKRAYNWATGIDVTFVSRHTLDKETFTNCKVSNFKIYNENAFSVQVYLEKNMTLKTGQKRKDILHDVFYYVNIDGEYKLVSMKTVTEEV